MMRWLRPTLVPLCFALLFGSPICTGQTEIANVLEMPFHKKGAEMRKRILALGAAGAPFVVRDIIEGDVRGAYFARKSFSVDVVLHYNSSLAQPYVRQLLSRENNPIVVMITIRSIAYDKRSEYVAELVGTLDDLRVGRTIGRSHYPAIPVTIRAEAIEALEKIFELQLGGEQSSGEEKAELWRTWAAKRVAEDQYDEKMEGRSGPEIGDRKL